MQENHQSDNMSIRGIDPTYGHIGATGTLVWADPATDVACVLLTNRTLASGWTAERPRQAMFSNAVVAALC